MIENDTPVEADKNYQKLKDFFLGFEATHNLSEKDLEKLDLIVVLKDLLHTFPFLKKHLKKSLEKYPKRKPLNLSVFVNQLKSLNLELVSLKNEKNRLFSAMNDALNNLITVILSKFTDILQKESAEKEILKRELAEILREKTRLSEDLNKLHGLNKELAENLLEKNRLSECLSKRNDGIEEEKLELERKSRQIEQEQEKLGVDRLSLEREKVEFINFESQKRNELEQEKSLLQEELKRLESLREIMLMNEKIQQNSSFSFQNSAERLIDTPEMNTERGEKGKKSHFFSNFQTPNKPLSDISDRSQRNNMNRSIIEGLKFIHEKDENKDEFEQIKELEKRGNSVKKEEILSHVLENKTRVKKKLAYFRDNFKRQKKEELKPKAQYRTLRESSLKKMKGILSNNSAVKKHK